VDPACPVVECGNATIEGDEQCDKTDLNGNTCESF
jgi:hypothetical protein